MKTNTRYLAGACWLAGLAATGCGVLGSSDKSAGHGSNLQGIGGSGGAEAAVAEAGAAGNADTGDDAKAASGCTGLPGPVMVEIAVPGGTKFCIDSTEVTEAHYAVFLGQVATKPGSEHPQCKGNTSYLLNDPHSGDDFFCGGYNNPRSADPKSNLPVQCIDWCDAYAYCAWAGKRLCGKIGGGAGSADTKADPAVSQWYYVCSQAGKTKYPYGDAYDPKACEGLDATKLPADSATQQAPITEVGAWPGCRGSAPPFSGVFDMSGSVVEFTDECRMWGTEFDCSIRGGSFGGRESDLACAAGGVGGVDVGGGLGLGFRCCKDLP